MKSKNDEREEENIKNGKKQTKTKKETKGKTNKPKAKKEVNTAKKEVNTAKKEVNTVKKDELKTQKSTENIAGKNIGKKVASKPLKFIWGIIVKILMLIIIFISIIIIVQKVTNNQESFLGFRIFRVQTGSMIPQYQVGDVIIVKETEPDQIKIGDDVTYQGKTGQMKGLLVTHRVIDIEEVDGKRVFHTKGIANNLEDPVVSEDQINGVVQTKMYVLSWICVLLNNKYVFYFCGILPLTIYVAFRVFKGKNIKRAERKI